MISACGITCLPEGWGFLGWFGDLVIRERWWLLRKDGISEVPADKTSSSQVNGFSEVCTQDQICGMRV